MRKRQEIFTSQRNKEPSIMSNRINHRVAKNYHVVSNNLKTNQLNGSQRKIIRESISYSDSWERTFPEIDHLINPIAPHNYYLRTFNKQHDIETHSPVLVTDSHIRVTPAPVATLHV